MSKMMRIDVAGMVSPIACIWIDVERRSKCGKVDDGLVIIYDDETTAGGVIDFAQLCAAVDTAREWRRKHKEKPDGS